MGPCFGWIETQKLHFEIAHKLDEHSKVYHLSPLFLRQHLLKKLNISLLRVSHSVDDNLGQTVVISFIQLLSSITDRALTKHTSIPNHSSHNYFNDPYKVYKISETKMNTYTGMKTRGEDDVSLCPKLYILREFLYCAQFNYLLQ